MKILIVDDEKMICTGIKAVINWKSLGITEVFTALSAQSALTVIKNEQPNILLTDIRLAGMSGIELIALVRKDNPYMRVIVLTGYDEFNYARDCLKLQVQDFLLKPVDEEIITEAIRKQVLYFREQEENEVRVRQMYDTLQRAVETHISADSYDFEASASNETIAAVKEYIKSHLSEDITVSGIAEHFSLNSNYFSRLFKKIMNEGCNEYIARKRIDLAQILLSTTNMKVSQIATEIGYRDTNYFSLAFKKHTGVSPGHYREKFKLLSQNKEKL